MSERQFPIQASRGAKPHPLLIPWSIAELAYSVYSAEQGKAQTLERLAERGGFGPEEMDEYVPNWRERCSALAAAQQRVAVLEAALRALLHLVDWDHGPQFSEEQAEARAALASTEPKA